MACTSKNLPQSLSLSKYFSAFHSCTLLILFSLVSWFLFTDLAELTKEEKQLRDFDLTSAYGPCVGISRLQRYERAIALGFNPMQNVPELLKHEGTRKFCLWEGRVWSLSIIGHHAVILDECANNNTSGAYCCSSWRVYRLWLRVWVTAIVSWSTSAHICMIHEHTRLHTQCINVVYTVRACTSGPGRQIPRRHMCIFADGMIMRHQYDTRSPPVVFMTYLSWHSFIDFQDFMVSQKCDEKCRSLNLSKFSLVSNHSIVVLQSVLMPMSNDDVLNSSMHSTGTTTNHTQLQA